MNPLPTDSRPIGVFDSGVGGLTVLDALVKALPFEHFVYLGDMARVPYGSKSGRTVERYTQNVANTLLKIPVKAIVAACNTASALGLHRLKHRLPIPIMGVIEPGCNMACRCLKKHHQSEASIAVIGTRSTIASDAYGRLLRERLPEQTIHALACPLFVPLVEEGWLDHPATQLIVESTLQPLLDKKPHFLILGCTHYPLLKPLISKVMGEGTFLIDSAQSVATSLVEQIGRTILPAQHPQQKVDFLVTDVKDRFLDVAQLFLTHVTIEQVRQIDL
ncbi:glutamate racemase [Magnetococcales bacterium HHB-1]